MKPILRLCVLYPDYLSVSMDITKNKLNTNIAIIDKKKRILGNER